MKTLKQLERVVARLYAEYVHVDDAAYEAGEAAVKRAVYPFDWDEVFCAAANAPGIKFMRDKAYTRYDNARSALEAHPDFPAYQAARFEAEERQRILDDVPEEWRGGLIDYAIGEDWQND